MLFYETGKQELPTIILLHGGGLSSWSLARVTALLEKDYHVVTPVIDGHGDNSGKDFVSIESCAEQLLAYIDQQCGGKVFAVGGLSIGAQIVTELLAKRKGIAQFAILESALVLPIKGITTLTVPTYQLFYGLIKMKWFSKMQAKALFVPEDMWEQYDSDSVKMSKQSLIRITLSNGTYTLKEAIAETDAKVLVLVGEKEIGLMKKSAALLHKKIPTSSLCILQRMGHGELSLANPEAYVKKVKAFFETKSL